MSLMVEQVLGPADGRMGHVNFQQAVSLSLGWVGYVDIGCLMRCVWYSCLSQ